MNTASSKATIPASSTKATVLRARGLPLLTALLLAACGTSQTPSQGTPAGSERLPPDFWSRPIPGGVAVPNLLAAGLVFAPDAPDGLGEARRVIASPPKESPALREIAWVYEDAALGRFVVVERLVNGPAADAEMHELASERPQCVTQPANEQVFGEGAYIEKCSYGERSLVQLKDGHEALVFQGESTTFVRWVEAAQIIDADALQNFEEFRDPALLIQVIGPAGDFAADDAVSVANKI